MRVAAKAVVLGVALGTLAFLPMFINAAGHDSRSIFVDLANSVFFEWPFLVAESLLGLTSTATSNLAVTLHYAFYILVAWLVIGLARRSSKSAA